ncbi:PREDICTED: endoribonuclease Dicer [Ceratosolen solmsi marchali]|uniref:ribonuclease III n=1 Tax=Ceratosolen solmsi marchali TaxID=326594 RepID=A0AAJ6YBK7_9HYME|nr:PREDICTED: endoribonuclease Dicer [Ceratosolen solmsi marchali]
MDDDHAEQEDFTPRPYQIDLYEKAVANNSIIYMPTGSGKTYVAVLVIKKLSGAIIKPYKEGGKRTIFIANTISLVNQQCMYLRRHTCFNCKAYTGDMNLDFWEGVQWEQEFEENQILIMTPQIFLDLIAKSFIQLRNINLIVFDECHRAVKNHPMRLIMQRFEDYSAKEHPRVLGLSASLLNSNIKLNKIMDTLKKLEITFHAKIITTESSTYFLNAIKPQEIIVPYEIVESDVVTSISNIIECTKDVINTLDISDNWITNYSSDEFKATTKEKKLILVLNDINIHFAEMGLFGGYKCVLLRLVQLEYIKKFTCNKDFNGVLDFIITQFMKIQKCLNDKIEHLKIENIEELSSPKIIKLLDIIKTYYNKLSDKFSCIIFVQRRFTAKVLYHLLKELHVSVPKYEFIKADFVIGNNANAFTNARENVCISKWNKEALKRFKSGICNCLIATDIMDEGIDIPACQLIIRYFPAVDFRSYLQSKGRARSRKSYFITLTSDPDGYKSRYSFFQQSEQYLERALLHTSQDRSLPTVEEISDMLYHYEIEPYKITNKHGTKSILTEHNAISTINAYCSYLDRSKFFLLAPTWTKIIYKSSITALEQFKVTLTLPTSSPLKKTISGDLKSTIATAKKSAALKTCIELYNLGELNDKFLPNKVEDHVQNHKYLFPHKEEEEEEDLPSIPGTHSTKRRHELIHPEVLYAAFPQTNTYLYLHVIKMKPKYPEPNENRNFIFYDLLRSLKTYGILSTKCMPSIPSFPIFMNVGDIEITIKRNIWLKPMKLDEIETLKKFHSLIFDDVLGVIKEFAFFDVKNKDNSFLIVPVYNQCIDWEIVRNYKIIKNIPPSDLGLVKNSEYELALVTPSYRSSNVYVVTQVCEYLKANSCFPTEDYYSYVHYFKVRHNLNIKFEDQPLLEVKPISKKINCIKPRRISGGLTKKKHAKLTENFEEHLVAELCERINFPAVYWLKASTLPSILHRISQLLAANDLRMQINNESISDEIMIIPTENWDPVQIDVIQSSDKNRDSTYEDSFLEEDFGNVDNSLIQKSQPEVDVLSQEDNMQSWKKEEEPPDFERNADKIQLIDIEYYYQFMNQVTEDEKNNLKYKNVFKSEYKTVELVPVTSIKMLKLTNPRGPSPFDILQSLSSKISADAFDYERAETLGDSFLKFSVSLFLYQSYPNLEEGGLSSLKEQLVSNLNLYYCGKHKNIPGRMNVEDFSPLCNFIAPAYAVDRQLQDILNIIQVSANFLYEINIPPIEKLNSSLSSNTMAKIKKKLLDWPEEKILQTGMEHFLGVQIVSDKTVADCVEAIIGTYLLHLGIEGALSIVKWFQILPKTIVVKEFLHSSVPNPCIQSGDIDVHILWVNNIEKRVGYKFKNRAFLLQAFTHSSYIMNRITFSYQRLEFLGDAVLDFLLTSYIYESCGNLSPGDLTDLRSALVNNVTFACLAVRYSLHTAILVQSPELFSAIDKFVKFQEHRNFETSDELLWTLLEEDGCNISEHVDVPKILGDVFESLIGAIFLDTNKNLETTWSIIYRLMKTEIDTYKENVPKQPIRMLHEMQGINPKFS